VGDAVGAKEGTFVGKAEGSKVGAPAAYVGTAEGAAVGLFVVVVQVPTVLTATSLASKNDVQRFWSQ